MNGDIPGKYPTTDFLQLVLDSTREIFVVIDKSLNIVIFNKEAENAAVHFLGKPFVKGESILNYATPERQEKLKIMYAEILQGTQKKYKFNFPGGKIYTLNFQPIFDSGTVNYISLTCVDITTEEEALLQTLKNQELLQRAESIAGLGSWEWDISSEKVVWSDELFRIMGLVPGEAEPSKHLGFSFVHPADVTKAEDILLHSFKTGDPYSTEIRIISKDNQHKYIHCQGIILRNEAGRNVKLIGTFLDITNKKLLEDSIQKKEQRFQSLVEKSADMMMQVSEQRIITYASPAIKAMTQYNSEEVIGIRLGTFIHPDDLERLLPEFEKIFKDPGVPRVLEYRIIKKDGSGIWVEGTITNLLHIPGVNSIVLNQRDISQRKETESLLNQLNETLEFRARELSSSNIELERFAYVASHDLQEPLRMVSSFLTLLESRYAAQLDEKAKQYISFAVDGAERMKRLINDLLEYSRTGNTRGAQEKLNMNDLVNTVSLVFKNALEETKGLLEVDPLPMIVAKKTQMIQLFQNLVGNALKYKSDAPPHIRIRAAEKNTKWVFSVEDNGLGIPEKFSEDIFNIFHRLHGKNEYEGTGIGLAICKKIVEAHGGKIWVKAAEKQGSIFYFSIKKQQ